MKNSWFEFEMIESVCRRCRSERKHRRSIANLFLSLKQKKIVFRSIYEKKDRKRNSIFALHFEMQRHNFPFYRDLCVRSALCAPITLLIHWLCQRKFIEYCNQLELKMFIHICDLNMLFFFLLAIKNLQCILNRFLMHWMCVFFFFFSLNATN